MTKSVELDRRQLLLIAGAALLPLPALAETADAGVVETTVGRTWAGTAKMRKLVAQAAVFIGDEVVTEADSRLAMMLAGTTHVLMGPDTRLTIDQYTAEAGGELVLGQGAMLFDRDPNAPKTPVTLQTAFGLIAVRGTRFFAGRSKDTFGVFVEHGRVRLSNAGKTVVIRPGFGSDIAAADQPPSKPTRWKQPRIDAALELVGAKKA